ncbi:uncharacterized protein LOC102074960 isoform X3 [Zonotrichia albicollis]|uniref:uncharacterized protein LOC102074960 isoform X3 n=1 Tax=Zonotrichia albicollis TaxID=44394 RepID=UPI003D80E7D2
MHFHELFMNNSWKCKVYSCSKKPKPFSLLFCSLSLGDSRWELSKPDKGDLTRTCGEGTSPRQGSVRSPPLLEQAAETWTDRRHLARLNTWSSANQVGSPDVRQAVCAHQLARRQPGHQHGEHQGAPQALPPLQRGGAGPGPLPWLQWALLGCGGRHQCAEKSSLATEHKGILEKKLLEDRQLLEKLKEEPAVHSMMPSPPKKSRKTFPKWTPGNASRKHPSDRTCPAKPLLRVAEASLPHDASSSSILKDRRVLGSVAGSPRSLAAPPHPASAFTPPSSFITMAMPGPGTSQSEEDRAGPAARDYVALPMKRKSDGIFSPCQQQICLNSREEQKIDALQELDGFERAHKNFSPAEVERVEKMEQLERMVLDLQQDVLSLKKKVQRLESLSFQEEPHRQPCEVVELFNGYTKEQLKETIRFDQKISTACKTLLYKLFTSDYIQSHSITGRRGNTFREAKPMMDERCIKIIRVLLKQKFGDHLSDTVITEKIQNVQKALRQKFKTECL